MTLVVRDLSRTPPSMSVFCSLRVFDVVTWVIVIVGWFIFHHLAGKRDKRNTLSHKIDDAVSLIENIEEFSHKFWSKPGDNQEEQALQRQEMILKISRLEGRIHYLQGQVSKLGCDAYLNDFSRSVLDDDGESLGRTALRAENERFGRIRGAAQKLTEQLRRGH